MKLERIILQVLVDCSPRLLRHDILCNEASIHWSDFVSTSELDQSLRALETKRQVVSIRNGEDGTLRWGITDQGFARLKKGDA